MPVHEPGQPFWQVSVGAVVVHVEVFPVQVLQLSLTQVKSAGQFARPPHDALQFATQPVVLH